LLIDEVETHLHYDAQADIIQMLAKQNLARKVIYTTHSFGCLPEDLGRGIRLVVPGDGNTSIIINKFWTQEKAGFSSLLFRMGATTMAFLPVRCCVLTEGPSDIILLAALLRDATKQEVLGFQIAPGVSESDNAWLKTLQKEGRRVVFIVDGDDEGEKHVKNLKKAGVDEFVIINLRRFADAPCVIEDFIEKEVYVAALNQELERSGSEIFVENTDIGDYMKPSSFRHWCKQYDVREINKVDIAYRILDIAIDDPEKSIVSKNHIDSLNRLYHEITEKFRSTQRR
jgi:predicted ATP-dependent endonuclease of OLD family